MKLNNVSLAKRVSRILKLRRRLQILLGGRYKDVIPIKIDRRIVK